MTAITPPDDAQRCDLTPFTTFAVRAFAKDCQIISEREQLPALADACLSQPFIVLGSGSNVLFANDFDGMVVVNRLKGITVMNETAETATIRLAAGENWHDCVVHLSRQGYYGLENLALIPGTAGAAPVQNIGAYGVEICEFIDHVEVFDLEKQCFINIPHVDCGFAYRDSVFKTDAWRKRYIICSVTLTLSTIFTPTLSYQGLTTDGVPSTSQALLDRVIAVRQAKLPDPDVLPNAGSFFKNPVISLAQYQSLNQRYPEMPHFAVGEHLVKIPAAWLIQNVGFKGKRYDSGAGVYEHHALILVNHAQATGSEIYLLACDIMQAVVEQFGIRIEPEVRIL